MDFIFENLWLLIILYGVFTSLSKGKKKEKKETKSEKKPVFSPQAPKEEKPDWGQGHSAPQTSEPPRSQVYRAVEPTEATPQREIVEKEERTSATNDQRSGVKRQSDRPSLSPPVQGMIWSQVYGPPRSKQSHRTFKK